MEKTYVNQNILYKNIILKQITDGVKAKGIWIN